jgi:hypothetical protein
MVRRKLLDECKYKEVIESARSFENVEYYDPSKECKHIRKYESDNGKFVRLRCFVCGDVRTAINPDYIPTFSRQKLEENTPKQRNIEQVKFDAVDRMNISKGIDNYEGDLRKDLLQPYNPDGSPNEEFYKTYGFLP